jgi:gliding motility-associated-like protein
VDSLSVALIEDDLPFIPNAFTPNGDGVNDSWSVAGQVPLTTRLTVFDRWGGEMHTSSAGDLLWNGDVRGAPAPDGVYVYRFVYRSECVQGERAVLGHVTLLR